MMQTARSHVRDVLLSWAFCWSPHFLREVVVPNRSAIGGVGDERSVVVRVASTMTNRL